MNCGQVRRLLAPFVGGQLDAGKRRAVELHVQGCAVCAKELADLKATVEALHSLDPMPVPSGFVERVRSRVEVRAGARFRLWAWAAPVAAGTSGTPLPPMPFERLARPRALFDGSGWNAMAFAFSGRCGGTSVPDASSIW